MISKKPKYLRPRIFVLVTSEARINPKIKAIKVAKTETVREFKRGVQNIFSLIDEKKTLSIYLYVKSPNLPPDKIASILVNLIELDKIENIGAITRYVRIITRKEPITKLGRENKFENFILILTPKDGFSINFNEPKKI
tara:strand:+ start:157 stop:573 length:417 start_codon:yes stop_codon:yes gene_type:complete